MRKNWLRRGPSACERSPTVVRPRRRTAIAVHRASVNFKPPAHERGRTPTTSQLRVAFATSATGLAVARIFGYFKLRGCASRYRKCAPLLLVAGLSACAGTPIVTAMPNSCASLLPQEWKQGVAGAPLPDGDTVADWITFADQQTGKLDIANDRTKASIGIIERCEARDAAAIKHATRRRFLGIF